MSLINAVLASYSSSSRLWLALIRAISPLKIRSWTSRALRTPAGEASHFASRSLASVILASRSRTRAEFRAASRSRLTRAFWASIRSRRTASSHAFAEAMAWIFAAVDALNVKLDYFLSSDDKFWLNGDLS